MKYHPVVNQSFIKLTFVSWRLLLGALLTHFTFSAITLQYAAAGCPTPYIPACKIQVLVKSLHQPAVSVWWKHGALSGKDLSFTGCYPQRHPVERHLNMDLCSVLLPVMLFYYTPTHEHIKWSFRLCAIALPISFKTPLCYVHVHWHKTLQVLLMSLNTFHSPLTTVFTARRHSPMICHRRGTPKKHLFFFSFIAHGVRLIKPALPLRDGQWTQFAWLTVTLHQAAPTNSINHQLSDKPESASPSFR